MDISKISEKSCNAVIFPGVIGANSENFNINIMDPAVIGVFIPIIGIAAGVIIVAYLRRYENAERMAMIEKGVDPSVFAKRARNTSAPLRFALLFIGVGLGLLLGNALDNAFNMQETAYFAMVFICGGIGLLVAYIIEEKKAKEEQS